MRRLAIVLLAVLAIGVPGPVAAATNGRAGSPFRASPSAIVPGTANRTSLALTATYDATLRLDWTSRRVRVDDRITVTNTSGGAIDQIELNTVAARLGSMRSMSVLVDGARVAARVSDQTLIVPLGGILGAGEMVSLRVRFVATLRSGVGGSDWLFTRANGIIDMYRWLPWVSKVVRFNRPNHGDPFVTPVSPLVRVTVESDRKLVLATTGDQVSVSTDGLTRVFEARQVRDFTVTAATDYRTATRKVGATTVKVFYRAGTSGAAMLDAAADALGVLGGKLGAYPYPTFKVVQSAGAYGMESPGLVWIPTGTPSGNLRYLTTHETAHQWFYGLVGNDQSRHPFADEAAADAVTRKILGMRRASHCATGRLDRSIYSYTSACYYEIVYIQGGNLLDTVRSRMGTTVWWNALKSYVAANRYGLVTSRTLLDALDDATVLNLEPTFRARFPGLY
jgi:hypothetical protein